MQSPHVDLKTQLAELDDLLERHALALGSDAEAYRNHAYRVVNLCSAFAQPSEGELRRIVIAAAFHDLGIWTDRTFDYLEPSRRRACEHLESLGEQGWSAEIGAMVLEHHKISRCTGVASPLVEPFRKADWADVSMGVVAFGAQRGFVRELFAAFPSAGFHARLLALAFERFRRHPLSALPMLKL